MEDLATQLDFIVLMPVYNDKAGLITALKSIRYEAKKFGVVIVDDGSVEPVAEGYLRLMLSPETPLKLIRLDPNVGITGALNAGLDWIYANQDAGFRAKYIARLDSGDICSEDRFEKQVRFFEANDDIFLLGSWCVFEDFDTGEKFVYRTPTVDSEIRKAMHFRNIFIHPTVMWRLKMSEKFKHYPADFPHAEDYGMFYRWMANDIKTAILPERLVTCRINPRGLSLANRAYQLKSRIKVIQAYGENKLFTAIGVLKLWALLALPYSLVFKVKKLIATDK